VRYIYQHDVEEILLRLGPGRHLFWVVDPIASPLDALLPCVLMLPRCHTTMQEVVADVRNYAIISVGLNEVARYPFLLGLIKYKSRVGTSRTSHPRVVLAIDVLLTHITRLLWTLQIAMHLDNILFCISLLHGKHLSHSVVFLFLQTSPTKFSRFLDVHFFQNDCGCPQSYSTCQL
jgi:hypothetical protein